MCIMQRTTKKIYLRMKSGAGCTGLSHSAASSFTGSPATSTGMAKEKARSNLLSYSSTVRLGWGPMSHPSTRNQPRETSGSQPMECVPRGACTKVKGPHSKPPQIAMYRRFKSTEQGWETWGGVRGRGEDSLCNQTTNMNLLQHGNGRILNF